MRFLQSTTSYNLKRMEIVDGRKEDGNSSTFLVCFESSANEIYGYGGSVTTIRMIIIVLGSGM